MIVLKTIIKFLKKLFSIKVYQTCFLNYKTFNFFYELSWIDALIYTRMSERESGMLDNSANPVSVFRAAEVGGAARQKPLTNPSYISKSMQSG